MPAPDVAAQRLRNHHIGGRTFATPREVVSHLGAMQAQDYLGALWAVGVRMRDAVEADVERALAEGSIVRTWPLRGTLHFVAAEDARWMLELLAPRLIARHAARQERVHGLTTAVLRRSRTAVRKALEGGKQLTRDELYAVLGKVDALQVVWRLAHELLICFGPRRGKQQTFVLFDEWVPHAKARDRDDALGELARRYFTSHGPATLADFVWWSGLTVADAKRAMDIGGCHPERQSRDLGGRGAMHVLRAPPAQVPRLDARDDSRVHLLPPFDEYIVAYKDRSDVLDPAMAKRVNAGGGMIAAVVVVDGHVAGMWKRVIRGKEVEITTSFVQRGLAEAADRYARFLGLRARYVEAL